MTTLTTELLTVGFAFYFLKQYMYLCRVFWDALVADLSISMSSISVD